MTDEHSRELRELAQRLFAAGRAERPAPALGRRVLLIEPRAAASGEAAQASELAGSGARRAAHGRVGWRRWVALAALLAGGGSLWLALRMPTRALSISAEAITAVDSSSKPVPVAVVERVTVAPVPSSAVVAASNSAAEPVVAAPRPRRALERKGPSAAPRARTPEASSTIERSEPVAPAPSAVPSAVAPPAPALTLLEELDLLKRARSALRAGEGSQALALLDRHEHERAGDSLVAEATLLRIEVLAALGKKVEASELAQRFVRANPNHALSDRAKSFIAGSAQDP